MSRWCVLYISVSREWQLMVKLCDTYVVCVCVGGRGGVARYTNNSQQCHALDLMKIQGQNEKIILSIKMTDDKKKNYKKNSGRRGTLSGRR